MLKELEAQEKALQEQLRNIRQEIETVKLQEVEAEFGVKVGSIVLYKGVEHKVVAVSPMSWGGSPWLSGNPKKKDGSFGTAARNLYSNWTLVAA